MSCVLLARHGRWLIGDREGTREMFTETTSDKHLDCLYMSCGLGILLKCHEIGLI